MQLLKTDWFRVKHKSVRDMKNCVRVTVTLCNGWKLDGYSTKPDFDQLSMLNKYDRVLVQWEAGKVDKVNTKTHGLMQFVRQPIVLDSVPGNPWDV
jgi:hypothetical protein